MGDRLLIVNADDLGLDPRTSDAILACFAAARITSATAMVFMADSARAAGRARELGMPVGLHLNLSLPYSDPAVPDEVRDRQRRLLRRFGVRGRRVWRWIYDPTIRGLMRSVVGDQLEEFRAVWGQEPTHVDGHKHVQVSPNVALALPAGTRTRLALDLRAPAAAPIRALRTARQDAILRRLRSTDAFLPLHAAVGGALATVPGRVVEVMAHPGAPEDEALLMSPDWERILSSWTPASYRDV